MAELEPSIGRRISIITESATAAATGEEDEEEGVSSKEAAFLELTWVSFPQNSTLVGKYGDSED